MQVLLENNARTFIAEGDLAFSEFSRNIIEQELSMVNEGVFFLYFMKSCFCHFQGAIIELAYSNFQGGSLFWRRKNSRGAWSPYQVYIAGLIGLTEFFCHSFGGNIVIGYKLGNSATTYHMRYSTDFYTWNYCSLTVPAGSNNFKMIYGKNHLNTGRSGLYLFYLKSDTKVYHRHMEEFGAWSAETTNCPPVTGLADYALALDYDGKIDLFYQPIGFSTLFVVNIGDYSVAVPPVVSTLLTGVTGVIDVGSLTVVHSGYRDYIHFTRGGLCYQVEFNNYFRTIISYGSLGSWLKPYLFNVFLFGDTLFMCFADSTYHYLKFSEQGTAALFTDETKTILIIPQVTLSVPDTVSLTPRGTRLSANRHFDLVSLPFADGQLYFRCHIRSEIVVDGRRIYTLNLWRFFSQADVLFNFGASVYSLYNQFTPSGRLLEY